MLQLLAGGPAHLRPVEELTTRLCFVCFDGSEALKVSRQLGSSGELPDDFIEKYCANVYHGIKVSLSFRSSTRTYILFSITILYN